MAENRHIFNNLTQVEKIKPKIDNPIIVEDVTYNFSDLIENEWISHFPQYSHRMRSTFVKGAGIVDEHIANINQGLIQLEDELYRVYDKLSDDIEAGAKDLMEGVQAEVDTFIQARNDEVASFISDRKTEVTDFIKDRKNEVATFISDKQHLVDEFVQKRKDEVSNFISDKQNIIDEFVKARKTEVADFIKSKTNEVADYISQKEEQITKFIKDKDSEIKTRTDTLDSYTKDLEGKIDQFNHVIQGGEATEDKLGLIRLSTISERVQVATETTSGTVTLKQIRDIAKEFAHKPNNMRKFIANSMSKSQIKLTWIPPKDSYNNGNLDVAVGGVMIRMGESDYPRSITEGTLVTKSTATSETSYVVDNLIENKTYYFSAFPYSTSEVYNTSNSDSNHAKAKPIRARVYGITRNINDGSTKWTRTKGSVNMSATPTIGTNKGKSDFDSCYPWSEMKRVTVDGDTLVKIPKFWYKRTQDSSTETIEIADNKLDGYELHPGSGRYVGAYLCSSNNRSVSGGQTTHNKTRPQMRDLIRQRGSKYSMYDIATDMAIKMLYLVEFAENNTQALVQTTSTIGSCPTGYSDELGNGSGISTRGVGAYRGIEGILTGGNYQYEFIDGINIYKNNAYVCTEPNNYKDDTHDNYYNVNYMLPKEGYISKHGCDPQKPWIMLPTESKGTENAYFTDYVYNSNSSWCVAHRGWSSSSGYGLFSLTLHVDSSSSLSGLSARLIRTL